MKKGRKETNKLQFFMDFMPILFLCLLITDILLLIYSPGTSEFVEPTEHTSNGFKPLPTMPVEKVKEHLSLYIYKTVNGELLTEYSDDLEYNTVYKVTCSKKCYFSTYKEPFNLSNKYVVIEEGTNTNIYDYINNKLVKSFIGANALFVEDNLVLEHSNSFALYNLNDLSYITEYTYDGIKINPYYNDERKINIFTNHLVASKNGKYGIVNTKNGYEVTDFIYDDITCYKASNYEYCKCKANNTYDVLSYNKFTTSITKLSNTYKDFYPVINDKYAYAVIGNKLVLLNLPIETIITSYDSFDYNSIILYTSVKDNNPYIKFKKELGRSIECTEYTYDMSSKSKKVSSVECD